MTIALWILNALLGFALFAAGLMKVVRPRAALKERGMNFVDDFSAGSVKAIGVAEVLGALGLILPLATGIAPLLTPIAAVALAVTMLAAAAVHVRRTESPVVTLVLATLLIASAVIGFIVVL
ncbi:DoxX family protein [Microbacterium sp. NPDC089189]|uniref:DoxX family protein n=1 Tax=Microbacterium sp. NPDC089189 TaxID=3154972 RepID=UPI00343A2EE5